ncbi:FAD-dependent monooxygenase [Endozoicomonas arenosclerae]|uniref:FAD-dependent monooxygenase n=1 Tax=Endozoicomonas arenosclerae TaxID=1633495 RepID=UPI000A51C617|nr:FAD-dependent monooxygenase [Endozoicomonas arenosclerae]
MGSQAMVKSENFDVLVVGAGMVGAAIACALGLKGVRVAVFDRALPASFEPDQLPDLRVSALSYASEQILKNLGAWQYMEAMRMCPYRRMAVWEKLHFPSGRELDKRPNQTVFDAADIRQEQLGFIVENRVTQLGLLKRLDELKSVTLLAPATIKSLNLKGSKPEITLEDDRLFTADLLIGADGAQSRVRDQANIRLDTREYEQQCLVATVEVEGGMQDITWQAFTRTGPEAFLPLPDIDGKSYASIVWYNLPENVQKLMKLSDSEFLEELSTTFPKELPPLVKLHERGFFPLARRHAMNYFANGAVLAGDSAHTINPLAGQGVNLGFQDVAWLAEILTDAHEAGESLGSSEVLQRYEKARRRDNQLMMSTMDAFYHAFSNDNAPLKVLRNVALGIAGKSTPAVKEVMKYAMGISGRQAKLAKAS